MAKKTFKCNLLSQSSIEQLKKDLQSYSNNLTKKCEEVVKKLAQIGLEEAEKDIAKAGTTYEMTENGSYIESGSNVEHYSTINVTSLSGYAHADLIVSGKEIAFIEFGSGVFYNGAVGQSPNPKGNELGLVIGSYGDGNGKKKVWGYRNESGDLILTHGTKATMPMYNALTLMCKKAPSVIKEVFGSR
jgi:hypothetical protein